MRPVLLVDLVGLTPAHLASGDAPHLAGLARRGAAAPMSAVLPAVTCSAQASMLTGLWPDEHGAVGNGWLDPASREVGFWRQANTLVSGEKLYEAVRQRWPEARTAKLFWWWNMGAQVDLSITPRPFYPADGRKILAVYSAPSSFGEDLESALGPFPFFDFWGPKSGLGSSRWIAAATARTLERERPALTLCYLPHLDYDLQRFGPEHARSKKALKEIDAVFGELLAVADARGVETVVVSEYGIGAVDRPVYLNRALREADLLEVRPTPAGEHLDVFASAAFAVTDHQLAHVHVRDAYARTRALETLRDLPGVERVYVGKERAELHLDHPRAGNLVVLADARSWFAYPYWLDEGEAPDFARTVDIHRKPGYDPCELFVDPRLRLPGLRVARRLARKKLGLRYLMDLIPLDASLIKGSHGRAPASPEQGPIWISSRPLAACGGEPHGGEIGMRSVKERVLALMGS